VLSWRVLTVDDINEKSVEMFFMLQPKLDVLVIGAGDSENVDKVRRNLAGLVGKKTDIPFEIMGTVHAISTFNFLNSEARYVAAALFPPKDLIVSESEFGKSMNLIQNALNNNLDITPAFLGANLYGDPVHDTCVRIFGMGTKEAKEAEETIKRIRAQNKDKRQQALQAWHEKQKLKKEEALQRRNDSTKSIDDK